MTIREASERAERARAAVRIGDAVYRQVLLADTTR